MESKETTFIMLHSLLNTKLQRKTDNQLSIHGISFTEYTIMHFLAAAPNQTMRRIELAESVGITASGVTRLLAPMEKNHLISKEINPRDARVSLVKLTDTGEQLFSEATVSFDHQAKALTSALTVAQLDKLIALNQKLI